MTVERRNLKAVILCIAGFAQHRLELHGMAEIHERLACTLPERCTTALLMESWKTRPRRIAEKILTYTPNAQIAVVSYSWGNPTAEKVISRIAEYGRRTTYWAMIDPVPRLSRFVLWPGNLFALTRFGRMSVPTSVSRVDLFRQVNNRPLGRDIALKSVDTKATKRVFGSVDNLKRKHGIHIVDDAITHSSIASDPRVHDEVIYHIKQLAGPPTAAPAPECPDPKTDPDTQGDTP